MTFDDFKLELDRLWGGFNKRGDMGADRIAAMWRRYGYHPREVMKLAVDECLCDSSYPTRIKIDEAVAVAAAEYWLMIRKAEDQARYSSGDPPSEHPAFWMNIWRQNVQLWEHDSKAIVPDQDRLFSEHLRECGGCGSQQTAIATIARGVASRLALPLPATHKPSTPTTGA
jgi:hypothetical protein